MVCSCQLLKQLKKVSEGRLDTFTQILEGAVYKKEQQKRMEEWHKAKAREEREKRKKERTEETRKCEALNTMVRESQQVIARQAEVAMLQVTQLLLGSCTVVCLVSLLSYSVEMCGCVLIKHVKTDSFCLI